jgi:hypothetical protein
MKKNKSVFKTNVVYGVLVLVPLAVIVNPQIWQISQITMNLRRRLHNLPGLIRPEKFR